MCLFKRVCVFILSTATVKAIVYLGCYNDDGDKRVLANMEADSDQNTPAQCARRCSQYRYAGVKHKKCFCGNALTATKLSDTFCQEKCRGNSSVICGDKWRISVYTNWDTACGPPPDIANGNATLRNGTTLGYGSIADVLCAPGFISKPTITCFSNASWEITNCEQTGTGTNSAESTTGAITANVTTDGYTSQLSSPNGSSAHGTSPGGTTQPSIHKDNPMHGSLTTAHLYATTIIDFNAKIPSPRESTDNTKAIGVYIGGAIGLLCAVGAVVVIIVLRRRGALACKTGANTNTTHKTNAGSLAITSRSYGDTVEKHNYLILEKRAQSVHDAFDHYNTADESNTDNRDTDNYNSIGDEPDYSLNDDNGEYDYTTNAVSTGPNSMKPDNVYNKLKKVRPEAYDHVGRRVHSVCQADNDYNHIHHHGSKPFAQGIGTNDIEQVDYDVINAKTIKLPSGDTVDYAHVKV